MLGFGYGIGELLARRFPARPGIIAGALVGAIPSLVNLSRYGSVIWMAHFTPIAERAPMSFATFAAKFLKALADSWAALTPSNVLAVVGLGLVVGLSIYAAWRLRGSSRVAAGLTLAVVPVLALQLWFEWALFVRYGFVDLGQTRYYYGLWPGVALGLAQLWDMARPGLLRTGLTTATAMGLAAASPPFCYTLALAAGKHLW
jgi:hypothetical protein